VIFIKVNDFGKSKPSGRGWELKNSKGVSSTGWPYVPIIIPSLRKIQRTIRFSPGTRDRASGPKRPSGLGPRTSGRGHVTAPKKRRGTHRHVKSAQIEA
jgi:hypothetical protein